MSTTDTVAFDETHRADANVSAIDQISRILQDSGLDATTALYDEALTLARQGLLGAARDRLRMLLCLDPDDGEAHLLLAKVFVAQQRFSEALSQLDAAQAARIHVPEALRQEVEVGINTERDANELQAQRVTARDQAEIKSLRQEARNLRTENTRMFRDRNSLKHRVQGWSAASAVLAGVSVTLLTLLWLAPGTSASDDLASATGTAETAADSVAPAPAAEAPAPTPVEEVRAPAPAVTASPAAAKTPVSSPAAPPTPKATAAKTTVAKTTTTVSKPSKSTPTRTSGKSRSHEVKSGDTLYSLAGRYYKDKTEWKRIADANRDKLGANNTLKLGTRLVIP